MTRIKYFLITVFLLWSICAGATYKTRIYNAFVSGNMAEWKKVIDTMNLIEPKESVFLTELLNYEYGYIAWCIGNEEKDLAKKYIERGEKHIDELEGKSCGESVIYAYKSAFYGFRIGMNKMQAPYQGPRSIDCAKKALELDPADPFCIIQYAYAQYYMPAVFGGSKIRAVEYYLKAEKIMEECAGGVRDDWNYLNLLATIAHAYEETGQKQKAADLLIKILAIEPGCTWIKEDIYPRVMEGRN